MADDDDEYCSVCGDPKFDEDGFETHEDEEEYDHDFEPEEPTTLEDVKEFADTVKSLAEAGKAVKEVLQPSEKYKQEEFVRPPPKGKFIEGQHSDPKSIQRHKETIKWTKIGITVGAIIGIIAIASSMF